MHHCSAVSYPIFFFKMLWSVQNSNVLSAVSVLTCVDWVIIIGGGVSIWLVMPEMRIKSSPCLVKHTVNCVGLEFKPGARG